jgi:hypothetical protein
MMASDRTKILFSTDRAADSGSMLIRSRPSQPRVNPAYLRETTAIPPGAAPRGMERHSIEFIDENAFKANRPCGKNSSTNGRRFCRRKSPIASERKWAVWRATPILSAVSKWQETPGSSIRASSDRRPFAILNL